MRGEPETARGPRQPLLNRARRIEGQARGVARMIEQGRECGEVVQQVSALRAAVERLGYELVQSNLRACLREADMTPPMASELEKALTAIAGLRS